MGKRPDKMHRLIADALACGDGSVLRREYAGREIEFFKERGRVYAPVLERFFYALVRREADLIVAIGPRGGSKTLTAADAALALFLMHEFDVFYLGGSELQAKRGYQYAGEILRSDAKVAELLKDELKTAATGPRGNWFRIAAASQKAVRGAHPGDVHAEMGWVEHGGLLVLDERDEMDDDLAMAAEGGMGNADPGITLVTSTAHRDQGGISEAEEKAVESGAKVFRWDILDVCQVCTHDCRSCPGGQAFAGPLWGKDEVGNGKVVEGEVAWELPVPAGMERGVLQPGVPPVPMVTEESLAAWEQFKKENNWPEGEREYCGGKAKLHPAGHVRMDAIFRMFRKLGNRENFEVEYLCRKRRGVRTVVNRADLVRALDWGAGYLPEYEVTAHIDWGFKGWAVVSFIQRQYNRTVILDAEYFQLAPVRVIIDALNERRETWGVARVFADASHPYENLELAAAGFDVTEVAFARYKELGAGWLRGIAERGELVIPGRREENGEFSFPTPGLGELFRQLLGWKRGPDGKIQKGDDHGPDSLVTGGVCYGSEPEPEFDYKSAGLRRSMGLLD